MYSIKIQIIQNIKITKLFINCIWNYSLLIFSIKILLEPGNLAHRVSFPYMLKYRIQNI